MLLARFAVRRPKLVIGLHVALALAAAGGLARLRQTDDLLIFLPPDDPDVRAFRDVSNTFGALQLAVVGVEAPAGDDVFSPDVVQRIAEASQALKGVRGVDRVVSLTNLPDFSPEADMVQVRPLIESPPESAAARKALRDKVMSRSHVVGSFVDREGRSTLMLVYLASGVSFRQVAHAIRATCEGAFAPLRVAYGGGPFAAATIYDETNRDILRLTPFALLLILGVVLITFRDPVGVALTVITVVWATAIVLGVMGWLGEPYTVISGTLPVLLFASGSSYAVHLLGRYYSDGGAAQGEGAAERAAAIVASPVAIAGLTTSAGFFSFVAMDIRPMRTFGLEGGAGVVLCWISAMTLVPAVVELWPRARSRPVDTGRLADLLDALARWANRRRKAILAAAALVAVATVPPMLRVEVRMDARAFFSPGSDPWEAERFLDQKFGGSQFIQIAVGGDMTDPATLVEIQRLTEFARALPDVTQVIAITDPLMLVNEVMGGGRRLPETRQQVNNLLLFIEGEPYIKSVLATEKKDQALVHVRVRGDARKVLASVEEFLGRSFHRRPGQPTPDDVARRLEWIARGAGRPLPARSADRAVEASRVRPEDAPHLAPMRRAAATALLDGDGEFLPKIDNPQVRDRIVDRVASDDPDARAIFIGAAPSPEEGLLAWSELGRRVRAEVRRLAADDGLAVLGVDLPADAQHAARNALGDLRPEKPIEVAPRALTTVVAGEPVLDRGFSRSVGLNQEKSLIVSIVAVYLLLIILFRSFWLSLVSMVSALLAMALLFGGMGIARVPIDISTSLVASIATGAGSDFAMHYLWYFKRRSPREAVRVVGPVMALGALLVSAGFAVLGLGQSQPMRMFGTLAAAAMGVAFALTFLLVPALLHKVGPAQEESP